MKINFSKLSIAVIAAMSLSACGGHHHSSNNNNQNAEDDSVYFDVQVVDGALENACGWIDQIPNFQQDEGEPRACTDYEGKAQFEVKKSALKNDDGSDRSRLKLIFAANKGAATNHLFGQKQGLDFKKDLFFSGYAFIKDGKIENAMLSPFSTFVSTAHEATGSGELSKEVYESNIDDLGDLFGIPKGTLGKM